MTAIGREDEYDELFLFWHQMTWKCAGGGIKQMKFPSVKEGFFWSKDEKPKWMCCLSLVSRWSWQYCHHSLMCYGQSPYTYMNVKENSNLNHMYKCKGQCVKHSNKWGRMGCSWLWHQATGSIITSVWHWFPYLNRVCKLLKEIKTSKFSKIKSIYLTLFPTDSEHFGLRNSS